jgi:beta-glucanase (GH16 family)
LRAAQHQLREVDICYQSVTEQAGKRNSSVNQNRKSRVRVSALVSASILAASIVAITPATISQAAGPKVLKLLWADEFNGKKGSLPSSKNWDYDIGNGYGWGNAEVEYYTNKPANISTDGKGKLVISANRISDAQGNQTDNSTAATQILNSCWECQFTSAKIKSSRKVQFQYGRIEARMKVAPGEGTWPAFWMLGADLLDGNPWPECGEIDIVETRGVEPSLVSAVLHGPGYGKGPGVGGSYQNPKPVSDDYHVYSIEWKKNQIDFYFDDRLISSETPASVKPGRWVFNQKFFLILNLAMGGEFGGAIDPAINQTQTFVDYIRYYSVDGVGKVTKQ